MKFFIFQLLKKLKTFYKINIKLTLNYIEKKCRRSNQLYFILFFIKVLALLFDNFKTHENTKFFHNKTKFSFFFFLFILFIPLITKVDMIDT